LLVVQLVAELIAIVQGILGHFVTGSVGTATQMPDYEWSLTGFTNFGLTSKGNFLVGAIADIAVYGVILVDWIVQSLLNVSPGTVNIVYP
jgi:hypothetical protein